MRAAQILKLVPLVLLMLGCSDPTGPESSIIGPPRPRPTPPFSLSVVPASASIRVGETVRLAATISGATAALRIGEPILAWFSANDEVATVSSTGLVQGLRAGTTLVWATYQGARAAAHVKVFGSGKKVEGPHACLKRRPVPRSDPNLISC